MFRRVCSFAFAAICASTVLASAQVPSSQTDPVQTLAGSSPVAYVYVANSVGNSTNQITGYSAAANGALTAIPGSPFNDNVTYMALNGAWLFAVDNTFANINSYAIASNGALTFKDSYNVTSPGPGVVDLFLDHTGATLYADLYTTNNDYLSFNIDQSTGTLSEVNDLAGGPSVGSVLSFIGNNVYAYSSSCYHFDPDIFGVQRNSDGSLGWLTFTPPYPKAQSGDFYCPFLAAADPTNHVVIAVEPLDSNWVQTGPWQLATYTVDSSGRLSTGSTYANMPKVQVGGVNHYWMSPTGKYLAVGGNNGLQVFHFNDGNPITNFTGPLTTSPISQVLWDNANHLYALSRQAGKLYVYTVTSKGVVQAPGSPHGITTPVNMIVLPKS
jgi:hypothetical protein